MNMGRNIDEQRAQALRDNAAAAKQRAKRYVWVTFQKAGYHVYPAAASEPILADVSYLGNRHRHLFKFRIQLEIFHNDREVEFHQLLNFCEAQLGSRIELNSKSVEMLADDFYDILAVRYPGREISIEVSEDGENGCRIDYPATPDDN